MTDETTNEPFRDAADDSFVPFREFAAFQEHRRVEPVAPPMHIAPDDSPEDSGVVDANAEFTANAESNSSDDGLAIADLDVDLDHDIGIDAESKARAARRIVWAPRTRNAVASLALVAMMFLFVFPTRSYIAQKRQVGRAAHAVKVLEAQNEVLARQARRLETRSEIERLAREQFNMVRPGEQAYNVVEPPGSTDDTTTTTDP
jgi:cell division protein FtsB